MMSRWGFIKHKSRQISKRSFTFIVENFTDFLFNCFAVRNNGLETIVWKPKFFFHIFE